MVTVSWILFFISPIVVVIETLGKVSVLGTSADGDTTRTRMGRGADSAPEGEALASSIAARDSEGENE